MLSNGQLEGEGGPQRVGCDGDGAGAKDQPPDVGNGNPIDHRELAGL
jgi:hypothetical protein